ncbi:MAG TPA: zf-HC2 domain-containing protein [Egibacteraceae bacterium]|nr:zf-HC2 domain-containing protein [Egibacteraceae bacterium]
MPTDCTEARTWLSAFTDGEALPDTQLRAHVDDCGDCASWEATVNGATRRMALRPAGSPDVITNAIQAFSRRPASAARGERRQRHVARILLAAAGALGLVLAAATALGMFGPAASHSVRDLIAFEAALSAGFLLAAWRPERYLRGLVPVAVVAAVLTVSGSTTALAGSAARALDEASHIPVLLGALGLFVMADTMNGAAGRGQRHVMRQ